MPSRTLQGLAKLFPTPTSETCVLHNESFWNTLIMQRKETHAVAVLVRCLSFEGASGLGGRGSVRKIQSVDNMVVYSGAYGGM